VWAAGCGVAWRTHAKPKRLRELIGEHPLPPLSLPSAAPTHTSCTLLANAKGTKHAPIGAAPELSACLPG
jgi:hypothetical protein